MLFLLSGIVCAVCLVISMIFSQGAGNYIFTLFDNYAGSVPLLVIALSECLAISYCYGINRLCNDIELMTGRRPALYWMICWKYLAPLAMSGILVASVVDIAINGAGYEAWIADPSAGNETLLEATEKLELDHTEDKAWPIWAQLLIFFLIAISVAWIPAVAILRLENGLKPHLFRYYILLLRLSDTSTSPC